MDNKIKYTNQEDLQFANKPQTVPQGTERILHGDQRYRRAIINTPLWRAKKDQKLSYGVDWPQKGIWYGPTKLDDRLSQNVQDIRRSDKFYREYHEKLENQTDSRRKKFNKGEKPERDLPGRYTITIAISNSDDTTESFTCGYRLYKSQEKWIT